MADLARYLVALGLVLLIGLVFTMWYASRDTVVTEKIQQIDHQLDGIDASRQHDAILEAVGQATPSPTVPPSPAVYVPPQCVLGDYVCHRLEANMLEDILFEVPDVLCGDTPRAEFDPGSIFITVHLEDRPGYERYFTATGSCIALAPGP